MHKYLHHGMRANGSRTFPHPDIPPTFPPDISYLGHSPSDIIPDHH